MKNYLEELKYNIFLLIHSTLLVSLLVYPLTDTYFFTYFLIVFINPLIFLGFIFIKKRGLEKVSSIIGLLLFFVLTLVAQITSRAYQLLYIQDITFVLLICFIFSGLIYILTSFEYILVAILAIDAIIIFAVNSKHSIPMYFSIPFIISFYTLYCERTRNINPKESTWNPSGYPWYIISMLIFITATLALTLLFAKPYDPQKQKDNTANKNSSQGDTGKNTENPGNQGKNKDPMNPQDSDNSQFKTPTRMLSESNINSSGGKLSEKLLFEYEGDVPIYFKIGSLDTYYKNRWSASRKDLYKLEPIETASFQKIKYNDFISFLGFLKSDNKLPPSIPNFIITPKPYSYEVDFTSTVLYNQDFPIEFFPAPNGLIKLENSGKMSVVTVSQSGSTRVDPITKWDKLGSSYTLQHTDTNIPRNSEEFQVLKIMTKEKFIDIWKAAPPLSGNKIVSDENFLEELRKEMSEAYFNYTTLPPDLPIKIPNLSRDLTLDKTSDYEKAKAIEDYFQTPDFKYDLNPPVAPLGKDIHETFIFESKRGFCMQYASSMVLLVRAAGLPARYCEGYFTGEQDPITKNFLVREKNAHAFPEVYIAGYGWKTFEPTPGNLAEPLEKQTSNQDDKNSKNSDPREKNSLSNDPDKAESDSQTLQTLKDLFDILLSYAKVIIITIIILIILGLIIAPIYSYNKRKRWIQITLRLPEDIVVIKIFAEISKLLGNIGLSIQSDETPSNYASRILEETDIDLSNLAEAFNKYKYGQLNPSFDDLKVSADLYDQVLVLVRGRVSRVKSWFV